MVETVTIDGTEIEVRETEDGYEATERAGFIDYLRENVFTFGGYTFNSKDMGAEVAEFDDGSGYVCPEDMQRAIDDENVGVRCVLDGWLVLRDER